MKRIPIKLFSHMVANFYRLDRLFISVLLVLALVNVVIQYSANDKVAWRLINDIAYLCLAFGVLVAVSHLNLNHLKTLAKPLYILSIILLILVLLVGVTKHGAKRWLNLGIRLQPSELCKISVPLLLAYYFSLKHEVLSYGDYFKATVLLLIPFCLIVKQPDLGTAILVLLAGFWVMFFCGLPWRVIIAGLVILALATPVIWHFLHPYQQHRVLTLLNPTSDPLGKGYHIIQGAIAIGSGGIWGKGYLQGTQVHLDFIPEKHTDFVLTVLAEEFGFVGVTLILVLYLLLVWRGIKIMQQAQDRFSQALAGSITLSLLLYILINMGMVAGIFPVVGVPLPLISYGGSATVVLMFGFGILLAIARHNKYD